MFALSTVMLSTSTYAWFTMNKEVEMTGLSMSATAGEGMEISLACVNESNAISAPTNKHPSDEESEKGWKSSVIVGHYYSDIGKLRPASSVDGKKLFDATDASDGGKKASKFKEIALGEENMAKLTMNASLNEQNDNPTITSANDIPQFITPVLSDRWFRKVATYSLKVSFAYGGRFCKELPMMYDVYCTAISI